jgi:UDP-3-O-[3-hydroxymyristoyl] N-acetylglucosamine deacetylase
VSVHPRSRVIRGKGLHSGRDCAVTLLRTDGRVSIGVGSHALPVEDLGVARTDLGVTVNSREWSIDTVEHLLAAFGGLGVRCGVRAIVEGGEVPLADGGSTLFCDAISALSPPTDPSMLVVSREGEVVVGESRYSFRPADACAIQVSIEFAARGVGSGVARWDGRATSFVSDIAWARTFGFRSQAQALVAAGRARGADSESVMILDDDGNVEPPGRAARDGEFARHKLLDLVGDLYLVGGPPRGEILAQRPGHTATRAALARAMEAGLVTREIR